MTVARRSLLGGVAGLAAARLSAAVRADDLPAGELTADALIIGAGASGAAAAWRLASQGARVACLEQGDWLDYLEIPSTRDDWELVRQRAWNPNPNVRGGTADYPVQDRASAIKPLMYNGVGGSTIMWSCHAPRMHPSDFRTRSLDGVGQDWPIGYGDLAPYYDLNDVMSGISGLAGDPANPPRPPRQRPPLSIGKGAERIGAALDDLGWHWWPNDVAAYSSAYGEETGDCNNCGPCELACPMRAKASTDVTYWPKALAAGAKLVTKARVFEIETDAAGRAIGAAFYDSAGVARRARAGVVIVAANGIGTPRLLLLSASKAHPNGLANRSGQVGRNLMLHPVALVTGVFDQDLEGYKGITANCITSQEFYETDPSRGFKRGYMIQFLRSFGPVLTAQGGYGVPIPWGRRHRARFREVFNHTATAAIVCEDLAHPDNRITLDPALKDDHGVPAPAMAYAVDDHARRMIAHGLQTCGQIMRAAGAREVFETPLVEQAGFHLMGTARMGADPETSVLNAFSQAHDSPNLFVIDGSAFATAAAVNPTNTLQALALRAADRIVAVRRDL